MSRSKARNNSEICADCGNADPTWASINRGIYLCAECCSIHRSFGRHISQVKSLIKSRWSPSQLLMVQTLNNNGVNNIWEHCLLDNNSKFLKKKPQPKDSLHPTKAEFIRAKHQQFAFVFRPSKDENSCSESDLGKQLHSSVRTGNLELTIRLILQGADPSYFHEEKGTTPLHVAVKANQILQVELLLVYGADPNCPDSQGTTPIEYARTSGFDDIYERLIENTYEVVDKLMLYVYGTKTEHQLGKRFILPDKINLPDPVSLSKLQKLPNHLFEELVSDVYDEIDRREIEAIWLSCSESLELSTVPFLPVDPGLSATRNQGRQKLARFSANELKQLICDILHDIRRRQFDKDSVLKLGRLELKHTSQISDDEPLYDSVASDDDYAVLSPESLDIVNKSDTLLKEDLTTNTPSTSQIVSAAALEVLTKRVLLSDSTISNLRAEIKVLQNLVEKLNTENNELRSRLSQTNSIIEYLNSEKTVNNSNGPDLNQLIAPTNLLNLNSGTISDLKNVKRNPKINARPSSMYETREGIRIPNWHLLKKQLKSDELSRSSLNANICGISETHQLEYLLNKRIENVTHCIHDFWRCVKNSNKVDCFVPAAEKIHVAVKELVTTVPQDDSNENISLLLGSTTRLKLECSGLQQAIINGDANEQEYCKQKLRSTAYNIAKETKTFVTKYLPHSKDTNANDSIVNKQI